MYVFTWLETHHGCLGDIQSTEPERSKAAQVHEFHAAAPACLSQFPHEEQATSQGRMPPSASLATEKLFCEAPSLLPSQKKELQSRCF